MTKLSERFQWATNEQRLHSIYFESVRAVDRHIRKLGCPAYDSTLLSLDWWRDYVDRQLLMKLVEDEPGLPKEVLGMVLKRSVVIHGKALPLFMIILGEIHNPVLKCFAIAHEVGHVLLHGQMLPAGRRIVEYGPGHFPERSETELRMEIEANIYAIMCLVPTSLVARLEQMRPDDPVGAETLQYALSRLYGCRVDISLARERLLIHRVLHQALSQTLSAEFDRVSESLTWTISGAPSMLPAIESGRANISEELYRAVKSSLGQSAFDEFDQLLDLQEIWASPAQFRKGSLRKLTQTIAGDVAASRTRR